jgi:hypothetical protein
MGADGPLLPTDGRVPPTGGRVLPADGRLAGAACASSPAMAAAPLM